MKKFLKGMLVLLIALVLSVTPAFAATGHDNNKCEIDHVTIKINGAEYTTENELTVRLPDEANFNFDAEVIIKHDQYCREKSSESSVVEAYYKIGSKGTFKKLTSSSNPEGREDVCFYGIRLPARSERLEDGDELWLEFRYLNEGKGSEENSDTIADFIFEIRAETPEHIPATSQPSVVAGSKPIVVPSNPILTPKPIGAEGNPNTGVSATAAPLLAAGVLICAALAYAGKKH